MKEAKHIRLAGMIVIIILIILFLNQLCLVINLYKSDKEEWKLNTNSLLSKALNDQIGHVFMTDSFYHRAIGYSPDNHELTIIDTKDNFTKHISIDSSISFQEVHLRSLIDAVPQFSFSFSLSILDSIVKKELETSHLHLSFSLLDSCNKEIQVFPQTSSKDFHQLDTCKLNLGFLAREQLHVYYNFPFIVFWNKSWDKMIEVLAFFFLLLTNLYIFVRSLYKQYHYSSIQENMMAQIMHDLKRPLGNINTLIEIVLDESIQESDEKGKKNIEYIKKDIFDLKKSAKKLLDSVRELDDCKLFLEKFNLKFELESLLKKFSTDKRVSFKLDYQLNTSFITASRLHLINALYNLLDNAEKYSNKGDEVILRCFLQKSNIIIEVEDHGIGIPLEEQKYIFNKYYRSNNEQKIKKEDGYGLGLSYVKTVVEAHNGKIDLISTLGHGCIFRITLKVSN